MNHFFPGHSKKILFACVPADGHFNPLTGLAKHLQALGYDVRWYAASAYGKKLMDLSIPFYKFSQPLDFTAGEIEEVFPQRKNIKSTIAKLNFDIEYFFVKRAPQYYDDMRAIYKEFPFDLLICDVAFTGSIFVKELLKVPVISIGIFPLISSSKDLAPNGLGMEPSDSAIGKVKQSILRFLVKNILFRKPNKILHRMMDEYGIPHNNTYMFDLLNEKSDYILQSGTPAFEYKRSDLSPNIRFIGSLLPYRTQRKRTPWYDKRLNEFERIVLVTQGTVEKDINKILVPTLETCRDTGTLVVCTTGYSQTNELRARFPHYNMIIEDFIPFGDVLPYADVYITNGGYGGVMIAIENKVPMIVAGVHEGKNEICARIGYFKYGINLKTETPTAKQIGAAIQNILPNKIFRENIERLSKEFSEHHPNELCAGYVAELIGVPEYQKNLLEASL